MAQTLMYSHHKNFSKCLVSAINDCKSLDIRKKYLKEKISSVSLKA